MKKLKNNSGDSVMQKSVPQLAWPIFIQCLLAMCLGYMDTIMLSNYDNNAVGAVGNASQILGFLTLAFSIISTATGIMISQYLGAGKKDDIDKVYSVSIAFNLVLSVVISAIVFIFSTGLLTLMNVPPEMMTDAEEYMKIVGGFIFTQAVFDAFADESLVAKHSAEIDQSQIQKMLQEEADRIRQKRGS